MTDEALTGGTWQPGPRGVLRWVPDQWAPPIRPERDVRLLVACPTCRATVSQTCRSKGGNPRAPHATRLAPRLCPCGERVAPKRQMCERCRYLARKETAQDRERRQPTAQRRSPGYMKKWRAKNPDYMRAWREKNREKNREYMRRWRAARKEAA